MKAIAALAAAFLLCDVSAIAQTCKLYDPLPGCTINTPGCFRTTLDTALNCLIQLDEKSKIATVAGYDQRQAFLISVLSSISASHGSYSIFNSYVGAEKASLFLGLDSTLEGLLVNAIPLWGDYLKYNRIKGISCSQSVGGSSIKCSDSSGSETMMMGVLAPVMAVLGLYLH